MKRSSRFRRNERLIFARFAAISFVAPRPGEVFLFVPRSGLAQSLMLAAPASLFLRRDDGQSKANRYTGQDAGNAVKKRREGAKAMPSAAYDETGLSEHQREILLAARAIIRARYRAGWHVVGAALRTRSGNIYTGVHLEAYVGRVAVCAEAVAIGAAVTAEGNGGIETIVAVRHPGTERPDDEIGVVAPCGMCRELIGDYDPNALVLVPQGGSVVATPIGLLLPQKYSRG